MATTLVYGGKGENSGGPERRYARRRFSLRQQMERIRSFSYVLPIRGSKRRFVQVNGNLFMDRRQCEGDAAEGNAKAMRRRCGGKPNCIPVSLHYATF